MELQANEALNRANKQATTTTATTTTTTYMCVQQSCMPTLDNNSPSTQNT